MIKRVMTVVVVAAGAAALALATVAPAGSSEPAPGTAGSSVQSATPSAPTTKQPSATGSAASAPVDESTTKATAPSTTAEPEATAPPIANYHTTNPPAGATFAEGFDTPAAAGGAFAATYANAWQPYPDATGGKYWSSLITSAHDGVMDVAMDGTHGAAGTFGTPTGAWSHVGGTFSIRAKASGGAANGVAVMLWPTSNVRADGELNYPEGQFDGRPTVFHHSMVPGHEDKAKSIDTHVSWHGWHTYTTDWVPGQYVKYYLDGELIGTVTENVPTTPHRYMFQVGNWGQPGHLLIDWVATTTH
ncbi:MULTISPECIES: family 16 glycosylhydrolase [unclassified Curtobacterium]|uniref:family 16 glycosylhydrolase n=1 Tax=unclassified Curtobacterium TaxID=257496 RepID=UPI00226B29D1|nr:MULTISPECIES: family 16 glycosylhydrolase [unclassified Curtobacterium]